MNTVAELRDNCPCSAIAYCPLEEFIRHLPERTLTQHKCVEILKWQISLNCGHDIGWQKAYQIWVDSGRAAQFAAIWREGMFADAIIKKIEEIKNE